MRKVGFALASFPMLGLLAGLIVEPRPDPMPGAGEVARQVPGQGGVPGARSGGWSIGSLWLGRAALAAAGDALVVTGDGVNVRYGPSIGARVKLRVYRDQMTMELQRDGEWVRAEIVGSGGQDGWIHGSLLAPASAEQLARALEEAALPLADLPATKPPAPPGSAAGTAPEPPAPLPAPSEPPAAAGSAAGPAATEPSAAGPAADPVVAEPPTRAPASTGPADAGPVMAEPPTRAPASTGPDAGRAPDEPPTPEPAAGPVVAEPPTSEPAAGPVMAAPPTGAPASTGPADPGRAPDEPPTREPAAGPVVAEPPTTEPAEPAAGPVMAEPPALEPPPATTGEPPSPAPATARPSIAAPAIAAPTPDAPPADAPPAPTSTTPARAEPSITAPSIGDTPASPEAVAIEPAAGPAADPAELARFRESVDYLNSRAVTVAGVDLFAGVEVVGGGVVQVAATDAWSTIPPAGQQSYANTLLDRWAAARGYSGPASVQIVDPEGQVLLESKKP